MTDAEFTNESLLLENKIIGLKVTMERLRKFFEYALRELCNKNYAEAEKLFLCHLPTEGKNRVRRDALRVFPQTEIPKLLRWYRV